MRGFTDALADNNYMKTWSKQITTVLRAANFLLVQGAGPAELKQGRRPCADRIIRFVLIINDIAHDLLLLLLCIPYVLKCKKN